MHTLNFYKKSDDVHPHTLHVSKSSSLRGASCKYATWYNFTVKKYLYPPRGG